MNNRSKKITILGAGNVGASIAYALTISGMSSELVLIDINRDKAEGEVIDLRQAAYFTPNIKLTSGDYSAAEGSDIVIVTLGIARKPGQTRIDLAKVNVNIIREVMPIVAGYAPHAMYVMVSNPVDILTYETIKCTNLKPSQVIGTGTLLDTIRLRDALGEYMDNTSSKNFHAMVLGEHGDTSMVPWNFANVAGMPLIDYVSMVTGKSKEQVKEEVVEIHQQVLKSGGKIIKLKGATYYGIALTVRHVCDCVFRNKDVILPLSTLLEGQYGIFDVCLSVPVVVNSEGIRKIIELPLCDEEKEALQKSAHALRSIIDQLD